MIVVRPVPVRPGRRGWVGVPMDPRPWPQPVAEVAQAVRAKYRRGEVPLLAAVRDQG